jgi:hypothetical protein
LGVNNVTQILNAHFDGKVIVPDEPAQLPVGQPLRLVVELATTAPSRPSTEAKNLPLWGGEVIGRLTRNEIYDTGD